MAEMINDDMTNLKEEEEERCSLYISRANINGHPHIFTDELSKAGLEHAIRSAEPIGNWSVCKTSCGLIAAFSLESDADSLVQRGDLARVFQGPIQVARFSARDARYRQSVLLRDVPWAIPLEDLSSALTKQGIPSAIIQRFRQHVRVEVLDADHYDLLLRQGLDFFGVARFNALPERTNWWRPSASITPNFEQNQSASVISNRSNVIEGSNLQQPDGALQCYRCQGFWHIAANCRHLIRCVRCGEPHGVEFCPRPRNNPICCHCSGPHHAAFRQCPVRLQLLNATPISITLTTNRTSGQYTSNSTGKSNVSLSQQQPIQQVTPNL